MNVRHLGTMFTSVILLGCGEIDKMPPQPGLDQASEARSDPEPPPGEHDESFTILPRPLSVRNAKRVLTEATVFAPWGIGYGGPPLQALALNVVLEQPEAREVLEDIYRRAEPPGQLLALCGLQAADPERFATLAGHIANPDSEVVTYDGCLAEHHSIAEIISKLRSTSICLDVEKSKKKIVAMCERAG